MTHYDRLRRKRLGDILVDEDLVPQEIVISALHEAQGTGRLLSDLLMAENHLSEYELSRVIVEQYQAPFLDLNGYTVHKELVEQFPADLLNDAKVIPLDRFGDQVCFACQEIPHEDHAERLREKAPGGMYFYVASAADIRVFLHQYAPVAAAPIEDVAVLTTQAPIPLADMEADDSWTSLFDVADAAVKVELTDEDE